MKNTIYHAITEGDCEGRTTKHLGYYSGDPVDIEKYLDDQKTYHISLKEIGPIKHITKDSVNNKQSLLQKKIQLEKELNSINDQLKY